MHTMLKRIVSAAFHSSRYLSAYRKVSSPLVLRARSACTSSEGPQAQRPPGSSYGSYKNIEVTNVGRVRVIGLDRPKSRNAVNRETARELYEAFCWFNEDESVDVAVLYGKGGVFCAGYDLKELSGVNAPTGELDEHLKECALDEAFGPMGPSRLLLSKPVIAAVTGYAVAGGLELALMCDMRVAEEDATFGVFCRRFGVPLTDGGTVRLPALIGLSRALDMILTGRPVSAQEAHSIGLANRVVPRGNALGEALKLANQIAAFPQRCMRADRHSAYHSTYHAHSQLMENWLKDALSFEYSEGVKVLQEESIPGAQRFAQGVGRKGQF